jgi:hypothetical protein
MKNILCFFTAIFLSASLSAQDTTRVTNHYRDGQTYDTYTRNTAGEKEGVYVQYTRFGKRFIVGQYKNGIPTGTWNYYSADTSGVLVQTLNFDTHTETFVDSNRVPALICGPRFFGGRIAQNEYIARRVKSDFTKEEKETYRGRPFVISFSIDHSTLKVVGATIDDKDLSEPFKNKLLKIVNEMPAWLPPVCKDKDEVWRFSVPIIF